jgi:hypothetical protein
MLFTFKRILQDKQSIYRIKQSRRKLYRMCWKEKIQWQSVTNGLRKEHVLRPPFLDKATKRGNMPTKSWRGKSAVFRMCSPLTSHGYSKSIKAVRRQRKLGLMHFLIISLEMPVPSQGH